MKNFILILLLFWLIGEANLTFGQPMSGTYFIGDAGTKPGGGDPEFITLKEAIDALNTSGVNGAVTLYFTESKTYTESSDISLGCTGTSSSNTITIKPYTDVVCTIEFTYTTVGASIDGHFVIGSPSALSSSLVSTHYLTIDGSNSDGGSTKDLTILGAVTSNQKSVIRVFGNNDNITIKNCIITNRSSSGNSTSPIQFTNYNAASTNYTPDNYSIHNNTITSVAGNGGLGIFLSNSGTPTVGMTGVTVSNNIILHRGTRGIMCNYVNDANIYGNEISADMQLASGSGAGIWLSTGTSAAGTFNIYNNKFSSLKTLNNTAGASNGYIGIDNTFASPKVVNIYNNFITGFTLTAAVSNSKLYGIRHTGSSTSNIYYNTIVIPEMTNMTTFGSSIIAGIVFASTTEASPGASAVSTVKNNIIISEESTMKTYGIRRAGNTGTFTSDYNNLYYNSSNVLGYVGMFNGTDYQTLTNWIDNTVYDDNSVSQSVTFVSSTNLHIDATVPANITNLKGKGTHIASVTIDIDGDTRKNPPDLGADEFFVPGGTIATGQSSTLIVGGTQRAAIDWDDNGGTLPSAVDFTYMPNTTPPGTATGSKVNQYWVITNTGGSGFTYDVTLNYDETYLNGIAESDLRVAKSEDGGNTYTAYLATGTGAGQYQLNTSENWIKVYGLTSFSQFTLTEESNPLPVELVSFKSTINEKNVILSWSTATEINSYMFEVERSEGTNVEWLKIGEVSASGNSNSPKEYSYNDKYLAVGKYSYRLRIIDNDGTFEYSNVIETEIIVPAEFTLSQNYPNPFNPVTTINYTIPVDANVQLYVFSITGELVQTLVNEQQTVGNYSVSFDGRDLASGTYIYRLVANDFIQTKKMLLIK